MLNEDKSLRNVPLVQIFPEINPNEDADLCPENILYRRERLPSIVVEPTEQDELERESRHWPNRCSSSSSLEEAEETGSADPAGSSEEGEQQRDGTAEPRFAFYVDHAHTGRRRSLSDK